MAQRLDHAQVENDHILQTLVSQDGGIIPPLVQRIGASLDELRTELDDRINRKPRVQ